MREGKGNRRYIDNLNFEKNKLIRTKQTLLFMGTTSRKENIVLNYMSREGKSNPQQRQKNLFDQEGRNYLIFTWKGSVA